MPEFRIGSFRYTWKGYWTTSTAYKIDDVVGYGGSSWVCLRVHTSSAFQTDQEYLANQNDTDFTPAWIKMTDGYAYRGEWVTSTIYAQGDIIKYGGNLYLVVTPYTSGAQFDTDLIKLTVYAESTNFRGAWTQNTRYGIGDLVRYGGKTLKCIQGHTSSSTSNGPEIGNNDTFEDSTLEVWEVVFDGIEFKGNYDSESFRYKENDLVLYNGTLLRCIETHVSAAEIDSTKWTVEADGHEYQQAWQDDEYYGIGGVVTYGGYNFRCIKSNYNKPPIGSVYQIENDTNAPYWEILTKNNNFRGAWSATENYKLGDVVKRGGVLYRAILDTVADGSSLDYLDTSNWEIISESTNWRGFWNADTIYSVGDGVIFLGSLYRCTFAHTAFDGLDSNAPGDNGNGYDYWDIIIESSADAGMKKLGDLLTFGQSREEYGDLSTLGPTDVGIGTYGQLLTINSTNELFYKTYGQLSRTFFVAPDGIDSRIDPQQGLSPFKPWKTVRYACEQSNDGYSGFTTVSVSVGKFLETLPIIVPKRTVVLGSELRSTTISAAGPIADYSNDINFRVSVLNRLAALIPFILAGQPIDPPKSNSNTQNQVVLLDDDELYAISTNVQAGTDIQDLIADFVQYIEFYIESSGSAPSISGSNDAEESQGYTNAVLVLQANKEFLASEAVAYLIDNFPAYEFDSELLIRDIKRYVDAWSYDIIYTGNYKTLLEARYYRNFVLGSYTEDFFYCRDTTGVRNCTLTGLNGTLNPADTFDLYQRPTGGAYASLDPGWGPDHEECWIIDRSPYIQGVTNIGDNCVGIKIDGALHNGGNKSMTANDFTQVLSDGIGAFALNNGRTELVSVFTYYCTIGYYTKDGGIIRGTNGNCSYGNYGAISDGVDPLEDPQEVTVNGRNQEATVYQALAGEFVDEITVLEFVNAGQNYTQASASFVGSGVNAEVSFEDFRDGAVFEARLIDVLPSATFVGSISGTVLTVTAMISGTIGLAFSLSGIGVAEGTQILSYGTATGGVGTYNINLSQTTGSTVITGTTTNFITQYVGGGGYSIQQNNAQPNSVPGGDAYSITLASNDANEEADYVGKRLIITSGTGTGQYGYISAYNSTTKIATIRKDTNDELGWDHVIPGRPAAVPLDTTTRYRIEPRVIFSAPPFIATAISTSVSASWVSIAYGEITRTFTNIIGDAGTGSVIEDDGLSPSTARFNIVQTGREYTVTINNPGAGYLVGDTIVIEGTNIGGVSPTNDITITVTEISNDSTDSIINFEYSGIATSGRFIALPSAGLQGLVSSDGDEWTAFTLPYDGNWNCLAAGHNRFVAVLNGTNRSYYSFDGETWVLRTLPVSRQWSAIVHGGDKFVVVASDQNSGLYSLDGINWTAMTLPTAGDSSINQWSDVAYGKGIYIAIANSNNIFAYSTDGINWTSGILDVIDDSSQQDWISIDYGNNRFVAISSQGNVAYSFDGVTWYAADMPTQDGSTAHTWYKIKYAQGLFFAVGDTGGKVVGADETTGPTTFAATSPDGVHWTTRELASELHWRSIAFGNPFIDQEDSALVPNTPMWIAIADSSNIVNKIQTGARALGRAYVSSGIISLITIFDSGSGYIDPPTVTLIDPSSTSDATVQSRLGDGVLSNPEWINRGLGYRTASTVVTISGNGFGDEFTVGREVTIDGLSFYPGPGAQIIFSGNDERYVVSAITELGNLTSNGLSATFRISPNLKTRDNLEHGTAATIQIRYSQVRLTGHDFLDIGTGNFVETNYPELYATGDYVPEPESEVYEEDGGRVFYTSTDQNGNYRTGELFAVEQATGIVTISADFFDLAGLTELRLGGIRVGGTGAVIREFSTDALFTADSNNIVPTQRAIKAYLNNRLTVGGSEIATSSFIAGTVRVGPDVINSTIGGIIDIPARAEFDGINSGIAGMMMAQSMFTRSFKPRM